MQSILLNPEGAPFMDSSVSEVVLFLGSSKDFPVLGNLVMAT